MFSKKCFSEWRVQSVVSICKGRQHQMPENSVVFLDTFCPSARGLPLLQAEVRNLKNTFGIVGVLRGNTIRGNKTRNSERKMAL